MNENKLKSVPFNGDVIEALQDSNNVVWGIVRNICNNIGFTTSQTNRYVLNIQSDEVLSRGAKKMNLNLDLFHPENEMKSEPEQESSKKGNLSNVLCIQNNFLPLWLAKISITPSMKRNQPDVVEKLIKYQLEAKDVLANYFINNSDHDTDKNNSQSYTAYTDPAEPQLPTPPLSREELAAYMLYNERHTDVIEKMIQTFIDGQSKSQVSLQNSLTGSQETFIKSQESFMNSQNDFIKNFCCSTINVINELNYSIKNLSDLANKLAYSPVVYTEDTNISKTENNIDEYDQCVKQKSKIKVKRNKKHNNPYSNNPTIDAIIPDEFMETRLKKATILRLTYQQMKKEYQIDVNELVKNHQNKYGVKNVKPSFIIANNHVLLEAFKECLCEVIKKVNNR